jgi:RND family efflux transporter MFP subunit
MKNKNIFFPGALIAGMLSLAGCSGATQSATKENKDSAITVITARPTRTVSGGVTASGEIEAVNSASVSTRLMGTITKIYVQIGDKVRQGQLLAIISSDDITAKKAQVDAQIDGARADLDNAAKDFDRYSALYKKQSATASELDNATLRLSSAKARLENTLQMRREVDATAAYARLTAPFAGVITQKLMNEGNLAVPGAAILTVEQNNQLRVNAMVAESDIHRLAIGDMAELEIRSDGLKTTGTVTRINVSSMTTGGQYQIKIGLPQDAQKNLYAGMYVNVFLPERTAPRQGTISATENTSVFIPASALVEKDQLTGIFTVSGMHTAILRWVRTGKKMGDQVEVLSGLDGDERFIVSASGKLYNGAPVIEK